MNERFLHIIQSVTPVIVDFYADWCLPCKQMKPVLNQVKQDLRQNVRIVKVNVDRHPVIANSYNINKLPTVAVFSQGKLHWKEEGVVSAHQIKKVLTENHGCC